MKVSAVCLAAVTHAIPDTYWPGQNAYKGVNCGSVTTLSMGANQTCTIELTKGSAAYVNAGGAFITQASSNEPRQAWPDGAANTFYVHSYDGHGEANTGAVRFQIFNEMTKVYYNPGSKWNNKYPAEWLQDCYNEDDEAAGLSAAQIECTDNGGEVEGAYMMGFGTDSVGNGVQNVQIMNTAGHKKGQMYSMQFNDMWGNGVDVSPIQGSFNGTLIKGNAPGMLMAILDEDYLGELLQVQFEYPNAPLAPFKVASAFYSTIDW